MEIGSGVKPWKALFEDSLRFGDFAKRISKFF
jgi:hypothetical protein